MLSAETQKLVTQLDLHDNLTGGLARAEAAVGRFGNKLKGMGMADVQKGVGQFGRGLARVGTIAAGVAVGGLALASRAALHFEDQLNTINTIAQVTPKQLEGIGLGIRRFASDTGADITDLTGAYYDLLSAGVKVKDAQPELELAFKLSKGALSSTNEAVDFLTTAINSYNLKQEDAAKVSDMFAQAVADGKVRLSEIAGSFSDVASTAAQYKIGIEEIAASYGMLTAKGLTAGEASTAMNRAIISLAAPNGAMDQLMSKSHKNYLAIAGKEGLVEALQQVRDDSDKYGLNLYKVMGRQEAFKFLMNTTGKNLGQYREELDKVNNSSGALQKQYDERQKGLPYQLARLRATALSAGIAIGQGLAPSIGKAADQLRTFIEKNEGKLVDFGKKVGGFIEDIPWDKVFQGADRFLDIMSAVLDVVKAIPPEISMGVVGLLGLNKLSGGLLVEGAKNIGGGLIGSLAKGVLSKVPGVGKLVSQPVYVTNWNEAGLLGGGGGLGGAASGGGWMSKLSSGLKIAGAVTIAGASIAALVEQFGTFMRTTEQAQAELQDKADSARDQQSAEALSNLKNLNQKLGGLQGFDRILADTFGGKQEVDALENLSHAIVSNGKLGTAGITDAIDTLKEAQKQALARGNQKVADSIGKDIKTLQGRLATSQAKTTAAVQQTKAQLLNSDKTQTGVLRTIAAKDTSVVVNATTNVSSTISVRDAESASRVSSRYGFVAQ